VLDRIVELTARGLNALGFNGTRLLWKWNQKRQQLGERSARSEMVWRSTRGRHKMCRSCRALVPRSASTCPHCGAEIGGVSAPGYGRLLSNALPGASSASSLIILANGFWFLLMLVAQTRDASQHGGLFAAFSGELIVRFGSGYSPYTLLGEWWRIVTPIFLHGGLMHFFFNTYVTIQLGPLVEGEYRTERFWVIYLTSGIVGSAVSQLARPVNTVGASGAIFGLMGLLLVHAWRLGGTTGSHIKQMLMQYAFYVVIFSFLFPNIDHWNHFGGFLAGAAMGFIVKGGEYRSRSERAGWQVAAVGGVLLVLASFYMVARSL
jgi:membrane associated rhomboid family serine protease